MTVERGTTHGHEWWTVIGRHNLILSNLQKAWNWFCQTDTCNVPWSHYVKFTDKGPRQETLKPNKDQEQQPQQNRLDPNQCVFTLVYPPGAAVNPLTPQLSEKALWHTSIHIYSVIYSDANQKHRKDICPTRNSTPYAVHSRHIPRGKG